MKDTATFTKLDRILLGISAMGFVIWLFPALVIAIFFSGYPNHMRDIIVTVSLVIGAFLIVIPFVVKFHLRVISYKNQARD